MTCQESQKHWTPLTSRAIKTCVPKEFNCSALPLALLLASGLCQGLCLGLQGIVGLAQSLVLGGCALGV